MAESTYTTEAAKVWWEASRDAALKAWRGKSLDTTHMLVAAQAASTATASAFLPELFALRKLYAATKATRTESTAKGDDTIKDAIKEIELATQTTKSS